MPVTRSGPGFERLRTVLTGIEGAQTRVGWFEGTTEPDGTSTAYIAAIHEFGSPKARIPARPFMRTTMAENQAAWFKEFGAIAKKSLTSGLDPVAAMDMMGQRIAGEVRAKISSITSPALSKRTVKKFAKGSTKPLIDSGTMMKTLTSKTEKV